MDDSDGDLNFQDGDRMVIAEYLSSAEPEKLKVAMEKLIDGLSEVGEGRLLDWGTFAIVSRRALIEETGQEAIYLQCGVTAINLGGFDEPES